MRAFRDSPLDIFITVSLSRFSIQAECSLLLIFISEVSNEPLLLFNANTKHDNYQVTADLHSNMKLFNL